MPSVKPLEGILVVALEQALAAPYCSSRLGDAGARVLKIEHPEGDCARGCGHDVFGESTRFLWVNRGKESIALDLRADEDKAGLHALVARADVFIQNLAPGVAASFGFGSDTLRSLHPRLITCDISSYGSSGPLHAVDACDLVIQAESGLAAVSGAPGTRGLIGVPICDIAAGMNALIGVQQALLQRQRTGKGSGVHVSLFDSAAELMSEPYLQARYGAIPPQRLGLAHAGVAACGGFTCSDGRDIVVAIRSEREWIDFCRTVLDDPDIATDPRFSNSRNRTANRVELEAVIQAVLGRLTYAQAADRLTEAQTAFGAINSAHDLIDHPQLRTREMPVSGRRVLIPATPYATEWDDPTFAAAPRIGEHQVTRP